MLRVRNQLKIYLVADSGEEGVRFCRVSENHSPLHNFLDPYTPPLLFWRDCCVDVFSWEFPSPPSLKSLRVVLQS